MSAFLAGFGKALPARVVTNAELAHRVGKTAEWIESVSGIRERRYADTETVSDLGSAAGHDCLERTGTPPAEIGLLIAASGSGARGFPGPAVEIAEKLGLGSTPAIDIPIASAGTLFGLAMAMQMVPVYGKILLVGAETMSTVAGDDPNTAILFGDGAGAALITSDRGPWRLADAVLHSDGQYRDDLMFDGTLKMNGLNVILHASRKMPAVIEELLARQGMKAADVGTFLVHQANLNLLTRVAKTLGVERERFFSNIERYGNTSSASMLIAASEWTDTNPAPAPVVFCAFGAGFHWGAVLALPA
ncbi:MAG: ketoacyl-ACP synthase III [Acidobacteriota bacterium]